MVGLGYVVAVAFRFSWLDLISFFLLYNAVQLILVPTVVVKGWGEGNPFWEWVSFGGSLMGFIVVPASLVALFVITF